MTRTRWGILIFLLCAVAGVTIGVALRNREPSYGGKSLGEWLHEAYSQEAYKEGLSHPTFDAINQIGTNAIPFLLTRLRYERPNWQKMIIDTVPPLKRLRLRDHQRFEEAFTGFQILGGQAKGAIPELAKELVSTNRDLAYKAASALGCIGKESIPTLLDILTNSAVYPNHMPPPLWAAWRQLGTNASATIPLLIAHLDDSDKRVAKTSILLLGTFAENQTEADAIVPALTRSLESSNLLGAAALSLSHFKGLARPALPSLMRALNNNDRDMRNFLTNAIRQIDPNALSQPAEPEIPKQLGPGQSSDEKLTNKAH